MADQHPEDKPDIDPATGAINKGKSGSSATAAGTKNDKESKQESNQKPDTDTVDTGDRQAKENLGGRTPAEGRPPMGDQDSTQGRNDMTLVDPMTARSPDKLDELKEKHTSKDTLATRDP